MPLTIAHPAIILPAIRHSRNVAFSTGLVIGCLTPDFEYFLRAQLTSRVSHTILGQFIFCLPVGLILALLWQTVIKRPLLQSMPHCARKRLGSVYQSRISTLNHWMSCALGLVLGSFSHIFWDAFTHETGYFVKLMPMLSDSSWYGIPLYKMAQHASTAMGFTAISIYVFRMKPTFEIPAASKPRQYWLIIVFSCFSAYLLLWILTPNQGLKHSIGNKIVWLHSAGLLSLLLAGLSRMRHSS
jgi:hypothetical protein